MKILAISDIHGNQEVLEKLKDIVSTEGPDLIVFSGDIVKGKVRGTEWFDSLKQNREPVWHNGIKAEEEEDLAFYQLFFSKVNELGPPVLCVPGNMDAPKERYGAVVSDVMEKYENIHVIHNSEFRYNGFVFRGFGGEVTEDVREDEFVHVYKRIDVKNHIMSEGENVILVTHSPPVGERVSKEGTKEKGSPVVNDIVERTKAIMVFCGHAHEPDVERIHGAYVINPGPLKGQSYAIVDVDEEEHIDIKHHRIQ
jgi:putative phosphoesterase